MWAFGAAVLLLWANGRRGPGIGADSLVSPGDAIINGPGRHGDYRLGGAARQAAERRKGSRPGREREHVTDHADRR